MTNTISSTDSCIHEVRASFTRGTSIPFRLNRATIVEVVNGTHQDTATTKCIHDAHTVKCLKGRTFTCTTRVACKTEPQSYPLAESSAIKPSKSRIPSYARSVSCTIAQCERAFLRHVDFFSAAHNKHPSTLTATQHQYAPNIYKSTMFERDVPSTQPTTYQNSWLINVRSKSISKRPISRVSRMFFAKSRIASRSSRRARNPSTIAHFSVLLISIAEMDGQRPLSVLRRSISSAWPP